MLRRITNTRDILLTAFAALICVVAAWQMPVEVLAARYAQILLGSAAFIFGLLAIVNLLDWTAERMISRYYELRQAMAVTPRTVMIDKIRYLSPDQLLILRDEIPIVEVIEGEPGPHYQLVLPGGKSIPMTFVEKFIELGDDQFLCPVRTWGEGTIQHEFADALTRHLVSRGYASPPAGPNPARWEDRQGVLRMWGLA